MDVEQSPWRAVQVVEDYLGCENDEGYGCACCPGRNEAYANLAALRDLLEEANHVVNDDLTKWVGSKLEERVDECRVGRGS